MLVGIPAAYLAAVALVTCIEEGQEDRAKKDLFIRSLGDALADWPGFRGPRNAVETAILLGGISLDDRDAKLDYPHTRRPFGGGNDASSGGGHGVVAALKPNGATTTVEFKKQLVKPLQCAQARQTNRITQIRPDGASNPARTCRSPRTWWSARGSSPRPRRRSGFSASRSSSPSAAVAGTPAVPPPIAGTS